MIDKCFTESESYHKIIGQARLNAAGRQVQLSYFLATDPQRGQITAHTGDLFQVSEEAGVDLRRPALIAQRSGSQQADFPIRRGSGFCQEARRLGWRGVAAPCASG